MRGYWIGILFCFALLDSQSQAVQSIKIIGNKTTKEKIVDRHSEEKPINEIIYNFFSTDCFFLILFLLMQAYSFHHVLHKL